MVDPALLLELPDPGVDEGVARPAVVKQGQVLLVLTPGDVDADQVSLHLSIEWIVGGHHVELPPDELAHYVVAGRGATLVDLQ